LIPSYFEKVLFSESVKKLGQKKIEKSNLASDFVDAN